jgi:hypothetical protein
MVIASERSYPTKRVCPILKPSSVSVWTQTGFLTIRIAAPTGVWELHPTKRFATDCLNRSAARGGSPRSAACTSKKAPRIATICCGAKLARGRALCGAQIRNVRPVLVRTFRGYKIANRALLHRVTVPSNGSRRWDNRGGYDQESHSGRPRPRPLA